MRGGATTSLGWRREGTPAPAPAPAGTQPQITSLTSSRSAASLPACSDMESVGTSALCCLCGLSSLNHLAMQWPLRSAIPPSDDVPGRFSCLTAVTALKLKRLPLQDPSPGWLTALSSLRHLYWDPFLAVVSQQRGGEPAAATAPRSSASNPPPFPLCAKPSLALLVSPIPTFRTLLAARRPLSAPSPS